MEEKNLENCNNIAIISFRDPSLRMHFYVKPSVYFKHYKCMKILNLS